MSDTARPKLYVILGSHACRTGMLIEARPAGQLVNRLLPEPSA